MPVTYLPPPITCGQPIPHDSKVTRTRRGKTEDEAYRAAMPLAMSLAYDDLRAWEQSVSCPHRCSERNESPSTTASATYSYSRWHAFTSYFPFGGAGGWSCTATFTARNSITCKVPLEEE